MSFDSWNKTFPFINLPCVFSSEKNLHPFLSSGPFGMALSFVTAFRELAAFQSPVTVLSFCVNYWSVLGIQRSKELKSMVQMLDCNLKGFRRHRARSVVWLRPFPCQTQQKKPLGDRGMALAGPVACATWPPASAKKRAVYTKCHKVPTLTGEQGSHTLPVSVTFGTS